jgi:hypothetical protein
MLIGFFNFSFLVNTFKFQVAFDLFGIIGIGFNCCDVAGLIVYI